MAELRCASLAKSYRDRAVLHDVDLVVREGTLTAILGASGSGKTTLLRLIIGFIAPDQGTIEVDGSVVAAAGGLLVPPDKREMGYVAQEGALFPHLTVAENVAFGLPRGERTGRIAHERGARARRARLELWRQASSGALRRRAAPGRACESARAEAADRAARRAVLGPRRTPSRGDARGGHERAGRGGRDRSARDPRSGRGAVDGARGGRSPLGTARPDGVAGRPLPRAGRPRCRTLRRRCRRRAGDGSFRGRRVRARDASARRAPPSPARWR